MSNIIGYRLSEYSILRLHLKKKTFLLKLLTNITTLLFPNCFCFCFKWYWSPSDFCYLLTVIYDLLSLYFGLNWSLKIIAVIKTDKKATSFVFSHVDYCLLMMVESPEAVDSLLDSHSVLKWYRWTSHEWKISIPCSFQDFEVCSSGSASNIWKRWAERLLKMIFFFFFLSGGVSKLRATVPPWPVVRGSGCQGGARIQNPVVFLLFMAEAPSVLCLTAWPLAAAEPRCWWMRCSRQPCQKCAARTLGAWEQTWQDAALSLHLSTDGQTVPETT